MSDNYSVPAGADTNTSPWYKSDAECPECARERVKECFCDFVAEHVGEHVFERASCGTTYRIGLRQDMRDALEIIQDAACDYLSARDACARHSPKDDD